MTYSRIRNNFLKKIRIFAVLILIAGVFSHVKSEFTDGDSPNRDPKYFMSVSVPPEPCGEGDNRDGVCYPRKRCERRKGKVGKMCAQGFGECCSFTSSCTAEVTSLDVTEYVTTLKAPVSAMNQCSFRIKKHSPKVCQVRLDFQSFSTMNSADEDGICRGDRVTIKGSSNVKDGFTTCGALTGQHMYLAYGNSDVIEVIPVHMQGAANGADFVIIATQIPCSSSRRVPDNCLQYYDTPTGIVKSFDWSHTGQQQSDQEYTICVKEIIPGGSITWQTCSGANLGNMMAKPFDIASPPTVPPPAGAVPGCDRDWIQINGRDRICNGPLPPGGLTSTWGPYILNVHFDLHEQAPFPFTDAMTSVTDVVSCMAIQTTYPMLVESCQFVGMACTCIASPAANEFVGVPDFKNQGFCLQYSQT